MLVRKKSQELAGEATVPDSVITSCKIDKHGTSHIFCLKRILNVLRKQNDLIHGRLSVSKPSLFLWKQGIDYWFDTIVDQSFENLVRDAEQRDGAVALWSSTGFKGLGIATTSALFQTNSLGANFLAAPNSLEEKSPQIFTASGAVALQRSDNSCLTDRDIYPFALSYFPFFTSWLSIAFDKTGH